MSASDGLERRSTLWFIAAVIGLLFACTNVPWSLDRYEQAKQAYTSFEMVNAGHWFYQHTPNEKIANKPPLVGWASAAIYGVSRSWELAWRLPSFAAAFVLAVVLLRSAQKAYGAGAALLALGAFGLNLLAPRLATLVRTDMPLALVVFLLGLQIWEKLRRAEPWNRRDRIIAFALLTAAMLIKGPIVYAFLLPGIVAFEFFRRRAGIQTSPWCGWWPWLASFAIFVIWVAAGVAFVPLFYEEAVLKEFLGRFSETVHRPQPLHFYFVHLLHRFAPWSLLLIAFAILIWRDRKRLAPETVWLLCWSLGGLVVMSLIPSKRIDRIFPLVPPLALLLAAFFTALRNERVQRWSLITLICACLVSGGYATWRVAQSYCNDESALARFGAAVRREAALRGWRYDVVGTFEEGLLLYLRRMHFALPEIALEHWRAGEIDAVVLATGDRASLSPNDFPGAIPTGVEASVTLNRETRRYLLLKRGE